MNRATPKNGFDGYQKIMLNFKLTIHACENDLATIDFKCDGPAQRRFMA
jgi:hypothetical protein